MAVLRVPNGSIGVIGGTEVFALFLDRYDTFYLTRAPGVQIPGGRLFFLKCRVSCQRMFSLSTG
jgi:hypothetical protein